MNINIHSYFHAADHITVWYYSKGDIKIESIAKDKIWKFITSNKMHVADEDTGEVWNKEEFFNECELIVEAIIKQQWQNLVFKK